MAFPHDQYFFKNYEKLVKGEVNPPVIVLENEKIIKRHFNAVIISDFLRQYKETFSTLSKGYIKDPKLFQLFEIKGETFSKKSPSQFLCEEWLPKRAEKYSQELRNIFYNDSLTENFLKSSLQNFIDKSSFANDEKYGLQERIGKQYLETVKFYESEMNKYNLEDKKSSQKV